LYKRAVKNVKEKVKKNKKIRSFKKKRAIKNVKRSKKNTKIRSLKKNMYLYGLPYGFQPGSKLRGSLRVFALVQEGRKKFKLGLGYGLLEGLGKREEGGDTNGEEGEEGEKRKEKGRRREGGKERDGERRKKRTQSIFFIKEFM
jgi:hypothetical protein